MLEDLVRFIPCPCSYGICDECAKNNGDYNPAIDFMVQAMESHKMVTRSSQEAKEDIPFK